MVVVPVPFLIRDLLMMMPPAIVTPALGEVPPAQPGACFGSRTRGQTRGEVSQQSLLSRRTGGIDVAMFTVTVVRLVHCGGKGEDVIESILWRWLFRSSANWLRTPTVGGGCGGGGVGLLQLKRVPQLLRRVGHVPDDVKVLAEQLAQLAAFQQRNVQLCRHGRDRRRLMMVFSRGMKEEAALSF
jgi:hypothetical protein